MRTQSRFFLDSTLFDVTPERGFLPRADPLTSLDQKFAPWEEIGRDLPKLLAAGAIRRVLDRLPALDPSELFPTRESAERAMVLLSYFGHAYVWGESSPAQSIPAGVAVPWHAVAQHLGRPPVLSYASYALHNWRRLDRNGPIALGNLALLQNFLGGVDEEWFILVHVDIEGKAGRAIQAMLAAQSATEDDGSEALLANLQSLARTLRAIHAVLARMPEKCDPYIYYRRVRPYIHGWRDHPALPDGLIYEGVHEYNGKPQQFRGETGAQSSIVPALDAGLGIDHAESPLSVYLQEMRSYMPPKHRAFLDAVKQGPSIRAYILARQNDSDLREAYNNCVEQLERFRRLHLEYAAAYIQRQHERSAANPTDVGTGGTPFMRYLEEHRRTTERHLL